MEKDKYKKIKLMIDGVENLEEIDSDIIEEINPPVEIKNLTVKVTNYANLRQHPNHTSARVKLIKADIEMKVLDIVEGSLVQGGNTWYKVEGGFVHFSQVKEV